MIFSFETPLNTREISILVLSLRMNKKNINSPNPFLFRFHQKKQTTHKKNAKNMMKGENDGELEKNLLSDQEEVTLIDQDEKNRKESRMLCSKLRLHASALIQLASLILMLMGITSLRYSENPGNIFGILCVTIGSLVYVAFIIINIFLYSR